MDGNANRENVQGLRMDESATNMKSKLSIDMTYLHDLVAGSTFSFCNWLEFPDMQNMQSVIGSALC